MNEHIFDQQLQRYRNDLAVILKSLQDVTLMIGNKELTDWVSELRVRTTDPFMFVVVGEVKAGKSSFINALLKREVCKVAPDPCTDTVQQIVYGEKESVQVINEHLKKIMLPVDILQELAIVDTPGTNNVTIKEHQEITEHFIPHSDLIIFVFPCINPYQQSAWKFLSYIHTEWHKKVIFILQQADLLKLNPEGLDINRNNVVREAQKRGIENPQTFCVSAKDELEQRVDESGFDDIRSYIQENITGSNAVILKLKNGIETANHIIEQIQKGLQLRAAQLEVDQAFRLEVKQLLEQREIHSINEVDRVIEYTLEGYHKVALTLEQEMDTQLGFFSLLGRSVMTLPLLNKLTTKKSFSAWFEDFKDRLQQELTNVLQERLNSGIFDVAHNVQQMVAQIELKIQVNQKNPLINNDSVFTHIAERRGNILNDLKEHFAIFVKNDSNMQPITDNNPLWNMVAVLATGGGIAATGGLLAALTQGIWLDITGGLVVAVGLVLVGGGAQWSKHKVLANYRETVKKTSEQLKQRIQEQLKPYIHNLKFDVEKHFLKFDAYLANEAKDVEQLRIQQQQSKQALNKLNDELKKDYPTIVLG
ncbi:dynamin family protein [Beggiatoa leptomitoformis]|uniref:GTP-binding protein n=1 Tax=Beggiatoa leptomitoformis TaxID=288004 RepID=A0A2N9YB52_9GAMM|nr:dynamin family protein [Beggiatoa leptomitoformis]ALG66950.1 GTP-binding protein [Beggiatoa leptomitoformis]AUI67681.1 GTP-binding protein [Beggiatoa leptomitoformis]